MHAHTHTHVRTHAHTHTHTHTHTHAHTHTHTHTHTHAHTRTHTHTQCIAQNKGWKLVMISHSFKTDRLSLASRLEMYICPTKLDILKWVRK